MSEKEEDGSSALVVKTHGVTLQAFHDEERVGSTLEAVRCFLVESASILLEEAVHLGCCTHRYALAPSIRNGAARLLRGVRKVRVVQERPTSRLSDQSHARFVNAAASQAPSVSLRKVWICVIARLA